MDLNCLKFENTGTVLHWNYRGYTEFPIGRIKMLDNNEELTDIYLKENKITKIPKDMFRFRSLESLYLSGNEICQVPAEIGLLKTLKCLDLSGNNLKRLPEELGDLENLKYFVVDDNKITELPMRLNQLKYLRHFSVCDNSLTWLPQNPVYNAYLCEFRFWRNKFLNHAPYRIWLTTLNRQQKCFDIGCFDYSKRSEDPRPFKNIINIRNQLCWPNEDTPISFPFSFGVLTIESAVFPLESLRELCIRKLFEIVSGENDRVQCENNNYYQTNSKTSNEKRNISELYSKYLPQILVTEIFRGPRMFCELFACAKPLFNVAVMDFVIGEISTLSETKQIIVSVSCCSKYCLTKWKETHMNNYNIHHLEWKLSRNNIS